MRPLTSTIGMPRRRVSPIKVGHSSDSIQSARSGRQWSRKRRTQAGAVERRELVEGARRQALGEQPRRGHRAGRDQHLEARVVVEQALDERQRRDRLADARAVQPDERALGPRSARLAEALAEARRILLAARRAARQHQAQGRPGEIGQRAIERRDHRTAPPLAAAPSTLPSALAGVGAGSTGGQPQRWSASRVSGIEPLLDLGAGALQRRVVGVARDADRRADQEHAAAEGQRQEEAVPAREQAPARRRIGDREDRRARQPRRLDDAETRAHARAARPVGREADAEAGFAAASGWRAAPRRRPGSTSRSPWRRPNGAPRAR